MMNEIAKRGPEIAMGREDCLHSSGHGYKEELDEVIKLLKPEHFLPIGRMQRFCRAMSNSLDNPVCNTRRSSVTGKCSESRL